jgi:hypothetical protein
VCPGGFTGSAATGRRIAERGAGKPMLLELGGNGPLLVFEDADPQRAAAAANDAFSNAAQICAATGRVLAHENIADELAERIAVHARNCILGDPSWRRDRVPSRHGGDRCIRASRWGRSNTPRSRLKYANMWMKRSPPILSFRDDDEAMSLD